MSTQRSCTDPKSCLESKLWAVNASAKEYAQIYLWMENVFLLDPFPEGNQRAQAHTMGPLAARASSKERKRRVQTEISVNSSILAQNTQTPHPSGSPRLGVSLEELDNKALQLKVLSSGTNIIFQSWLWVSLSASAPLWARVDRQKLLPFLYKESLPPASRF